MTHVMLGAGDGRPCAGPRVRRIATTQAYEVEIYKLGRRGRCRSSRGDAGPNTAPDARLPKPILRLVCLLLDASVCEAIAHSQSARSKMAGSTRARLAAAQQAGPNRAGTNRDRTESACAQKSPNRASGSYPRLLCVVCSPYIVFTQCERSRSALRVSAAPVVWSRRPLCNEDHLGPRLTRCY